MHTGLNQNQAELAVGVLHNCNTRTSKIVLEVSHAIKTNLVVALKVLADSDGLLDEVVEVLGDLGGETCQVTIIETNG